MSKFYLNIEAEEIEVYNTNGDSISVLNADMYATVSILDYSTLAPLKTEDCDLAPLKTEECIGLQECAETNHSSSFEVVEMWQGISNTLYEIELEDVNDFDWQKIRFEQIESKLGIQPLFLYHNIKYGEQVLEVCNHGNQLDCRVSFKL